MSHKIPRANSLPKERGWYLYHHCNEFIPTYVWMNFLTRRLKYYSITQGEGLVENTEPKNWSVRLEIEPIEPLALSVEPENK